jgi:uroporphyrinogen decarboxylase
MERLLFYFMLEPAFVHDLLDRITEFNIGLIRRAAGLGVDCVHVGDDWGAQNGLLVAPDTWREFVKPRFTRTCAAAREAGLLVSLHSCGKVLDLLPDMVEAGVDVFDPFQPEVMDIRALRERYRGRLAFWGGLSVQETLPHGTPDDVRRETERLLGELAPGGGYVLAPSHSLTGDIPPENVDAFLDVARKQNAGDVLHHEEHEEHEGGGG